MIVVGSKAARSEVSPTPVKSVQSILSKWFMFVLLCAARVRLSVWNCWRVVLGQFVCQGLVLSFDEVGCEGFEGIGRCAEGGQGFEGVGYELVGVLEGLVDSVDGGPGGFDAGGIFACGLAQFFGALGHVEDVVDDLEGEAGFFAEGAEAGDGVGSVGEGSTDALGFG